MGLVATVQKSFRTLKSYCWPAVGHLTGGSGCVLMTEIIEKNILKHVRESMRMNELIQTKHKRQTVHTDINFQREREKKKQGKLCIHGKKNLWSTSVCAGL